MVNVTVRGVGLTRQLLGRADLPLAVSEGTTVNGLLARLAEERGETFAPRPASSGDGSSYAPLRVVVNGRDLVPQQREHMVLQEGDDVLVLLPIAGG